MKQRNIQPGKEKVLERKLDDLKRELRDLEGTQRRGFINQLDEVANINRANAIREKIANLESQLYDN